MKKTAIIMSFIFNALFVACITGASVYFNKIGLLWWYLLPAFCAFCTIVGAEEGGKNE